MKRIKELREKKGISQQALADVLDVTQQSIYKYENGLSEPSISTLKDIANYFETTIDYITEFTNNPSPKLFLIEANNTYKQNAYFHKYSKLDSKTQDIINSLIDTLLENKE